MYHQTISSLTSINKLLTSAKIEIILIFIFLKTLKVNDFTFAQSVDVDAVVGNCLLVDDLDRGAQIETEVKVVLAWGDGDRKQEKNIKVHCDCDAMKMNDENSEKAVKFILILTVSKNTHSSNTPIKHFSFPT